MENKKIFEYGGDLIPKDLENDKRVIKVNLPDDEDSYKSGKGEGIWAYILNEDDFEKYDKGIDKFNVILLNHSIYYMYLLTWGDIIQVEGRGKNRPVLDMKWFEEKIKSQLLV